MFGEITGVGRRSDARAGIPDPRSQYGARETPDVYTGTIKVENPPAGHSGFLSLRHAERWVRQGRAFFVRGGGLRLFDGARQAMAATRSGRTDESRHGYDGIHRMLTEAEKRRLPLVGPPARLTRSAVGGSTSRRPSGTATLKPQGGVPMGPSGEKSRAGATIAR